MLVVLTETYCNEVNIQITQRDDFIQTEFCSLNIQRGRWEFQFAAGTFYVKNVDSRQYSGWNCTGYRFN